MTQRVGMAELPRGLAWVRAGWSVGATVALAVTTAMTLVGCASPPLPPAPASASYVVLLPNDDGTVGKMNISTARGTTVLEKAREGALFAGPVGEVFEVSQERINRDFGAALAASPVRPVSFLLYFAVGGTRLNAESESELAKILGEIAARRAPDISVIGHTDTTGSNEDNEKLSLDRARAVAELIGRSHRLEAGNVVVESHGKKNLLVATPDNTPEARNRRVEVTVR